jgi:hypothetical protein
MESRVLKIAKRAAVLLAVIAITLMAVGIYDTQRGPPLELWHTYAPSEPSADEIMPTARATHRYASRLTQMITVAERCTDPVDVAIIGRCMADGERNR